METRHAVCRRALAAAQCERARLVAAAHHKAPSEQIARALARMYTAQLAWLEARLARTADVTLDALTQCEPPTFGRSERAARHLRDMLEEREMSRASLPLQHKFDALIAGQVLCKINAEKMRYAERYTRDKVLLRAVRELLDEDMWAVVHGVFRRSVLRQPVGGSLVEAAARVLMQAAGVDRVLASRTQETD